MQPDQTWTAGHAPSLPREGLHETLAGVARRTPEAIALVSSDQLVTYGELDRVADAWAAQLAAAGVSPGHRVPIRMPRSTSLVTALVAVLKTGAAYALLDPAWPPRRVREVLDELDAPLLITSDGAADDVTGAVEVPTWQPPPGPVTAPSGFQPFAADGSEPCCVFFTSGTTGRPRGVLSPHRATARLFQEGNHTYLVGAGTTTPLAASLPWDVFSWELWSMLLTGGTCVVIDEPYLSAQALRRSVADHGVDTVAPATSLFTMVVDEDLDAFSGVRQVLVGGERLPPEHAARFIRRHPGVRLLNGYGPVEATMHVTIHQVTEDDCADPRGIPLGRPAAGSEVHVLDGERTCAVGEVGEICIAGQALAQGYLDDPALTEAKFRVVDLGGRSVRVYRTGDLGSWEADGLLRFHGRVDRQVKVRGHRVELAEVERQVEELLPGVRSCRVLAVRDAAGATRQLVAFCTTAGPGDHLDGAASVLQASLVSYQRPAAVIRVDAFPLTSRGKLDEQALLALVPDGADRDGEADGSDDTGAGARAEHHAPDPADDGTTGADDLERLVATTFGEVLGRPDVPLDASFFDLGGDSLGAGRVCARLGARTGRAVQVSWLYQVPTAVGLAHRLHRDAPPVPAARPAGDQMPLTPMQMGFVAQQLRAPDQRTQHCLVAWRIEGDLDVPALRAAVAEVHQRHETLRVRYAFRPAPVASVVDTAPPLPRVLPPAPSVEAAVDALRSELAGPLDATTGVLWRTALVPVEASGTAVFGCAVHHIAFDGWSESVLADDLAAAYDAALADAPTAASSPLPSWADLQHDQLRRADEGSAGPEQDSIIEDLKSAPGLRWPEVGAGLAQAPPAAPHHREVHLTPQVVAAVDAAAAQAGTTRFGALLSYCASSLAAVTEQRDLVVCFPTAQRDDPLLERVIGSYVGMMFLRLRGAALSGDAQGARHAGQAVHRTIAHDVSLGRVMQRMGPPPGAQRGGPPPGVQGGPPPGAQGGPPPGAQRGGPPPGGGSPLFQVFFALQNYTAAHLRLTGVRTTQLRLDALDLPYEFHAELWPDDVGGLSLVASWRPGVVADTTAHEFQRRFLELAGTPPEGT